MTKAIIQHTVNFYKELESRSNKETLANAQDVVVFRGKVVDAFKSLNVSQSYYSTIRKSLMEMGCITILQQGAKGSDSIIVLHHPPDQDEFKIISDRPLTPRLDGAILSQRVDDLYKLIGGMDIGAALIDIEQRLREVERQVLALQQVRPTPQRKTT